MTNEEFSNEFDTLLNSYSKTDTFGKVTTLALDEYEKSIFLTKAQEDIVLDIYKGINFPSFEESEESRRYLDSLIKSKILEKVENDKGVYNSNNSFFFTLPDDLLFITYEEATLNDNNLCNNNSIVMVVPTMQDEYHRIKNNPFRNANSNRVLRLDLGNTTVELISKYNISRYFIRYLSKPSPIILSTLPKDLSINSIQTKTECKLNSLLHRPILERAVKLALASKSIQG